MKIVKAMQTVPGMSKSEIENFLADEKIPMRIATLDKNGDPQIHPVWYYYAGDRIYMITDANARKVENLKGNSTVYFSIDTDATPNRGVKGRGKAHVVKDHSQAFPIVEKLVSKYLGETKTGMGKTIVDNAREGSELLIEIAPSYYSVWDYRKMSK